MIWWIYLCILLGCFVFQYIVAEIAISCGLHEHRPPKPSVSKKDDLDLWREAYANDLIDLPKLERYVAMELKREPIDRDLASPFKCPPMEAILKA